MKELSLQDTNSAQEIRVAKNDEIKDAQIGRAPGRDAKISTEALTAKTGIGKVAPSSS